MSERKDEKYIIKTNYIETNEQEAAEERERKLAEMQQKVQEFQWDDEEEENEEALPLNVSPEAVDHCSRYLASYLLASLNTEHFQGSDAEGMKFVVPISHTDGHAVLEERYSEEWTLESRIQAFEAVREQLSADFSNPDRRTLLNHRITDAFPPSHRKKFNSGEVQIHDDAIVVQEDKGLTIEIPITFVANS